MKDWENIIKERQLSRKAELPESDWNDFLSRKAAHERATIRRRRLMTFSISIPAAAAILLLLFLIPLKKVVPDNSLSQNNPSAPQVMTDSIESLSDTITITTEPKLQVDPVKPKDSVRVGVDERLKGKYAGAKVNMEVKPLDSRMVAQNNTSVRGSIYDFDSAEPMYSAAVMIYSVNGADTTYIGGTATDENGEFVFDKLGPGNYIANARFMGYNDAHKSFTIRPDEDNHNLGKITIRGGSLLSGLAVDAVVAKVQMVNDTVQFNSAAYKLPEGASVEDLIRKLPGVEIDSAGNITVNGKSIQRILVNGKEFFNDDKTKSLTQLTAEMIEKVKAYDQQSDLSRQTGIDDGRDDVVQDLKEISVNGSVYDFYAGEPIYQASVQFYRITGNDSTYISGVMTERDGSFNIGNLKADNYLLRVTSPGYSTTDMNCNFTLISDRTVIDLGKITLRNVQKLEDVAVPIGRIQ